jgi:MinD-like ATPase involved in chromosome partitioning or flagellar assembly
MLDQAHDLRRLATERGRPNAARAAVWPSLLVVMGGKGGVGTTTTAVHLATALAHTGKRTLLVDADPRGGDAAVRCGLDERYTLADLLAGRRSWGDVIQTTRSGVQLVAGSRWSEDGSFGAAERLLELLSTSSLPADVAVIDVGNSPGRAVARICQPAETIVMVTTSEPTAVMGTFAAIRTLTRFACRQGRSGDVQPGACFDFCAKGTSLSVNSVKGNSPIFADTRIETVPQPALPLHLAVNRARMPWDAQIVQYRLTRACHRLLGVTLLNFCLSRNP